MPYPLAAVRGHGLVAPTAGYSDKVLAYSPIAYWPLWEASGLTAECLVDSPAQDGTYTGVTLGQTGIGDGETCPLFDGLNDYVDVGSAAFRAAFALTNDVGPPAVSEGTVALWAKVFNVGVWTDGAFRAYFNFRADSSNYVTIYKRSSDNEITPRYDAGGIPKAQFVSLSDLTWAPFAITWSASADEFKFYISGAQASPTLDNLGVWLGLITTALLGAEVAVPTQPWHGYLAHCAVWGSALTPTQILDLATV